MSSNFVLLPPAKSGNSVRLKTRKLRDLHMETIQLEMQNREMEQKLNQLRLSMSKEKEERERSNGYHWKSGQTGNHSHIHDKENAGTVSSGKVKLRVLKNPVAEPEKLKTCPKPANMTLTERPQSRGKLCGQCENRNALVMCLECGEDYCAACFTNIHQKGALKLHRTLPIQEKSQDGKLDGSHISRKEWNADESSRRSERDKDFTRRTVLPQAYSSESTKQPDPGNAGSLLCGSFNEEESAKYFNEAILEWRNQVRNNASSTHRTADTGTDSGGNSGVQTVLTVLGKSLEIEFKESGLTYMEKLMLKKHRRTPVNLFSSEEIDKVTHWPTKFENEPDKGNDLTAEEMEAREQYLALFRTEEHVRNVMHEPALMIEELEKEPEDGLEETKHFLVTDAEAKEIGNRSESLLVAENQRLQPVPPRVSDKSPARSVEKQRSVHLRSTYCIDKEEPLNSFQDKILAKASHLEDSKSMKYKSFQDSRSLDPALMQNVPQDFQNVILRDKNRTSEYQGFKGFFTLETETVHQKEGDDLHCPQTTNLASDTFNIAGQITCRASDNWRPESSLSRCADENIVQDVVAKTQPYDNNVMDRCATPRYGHQRISAPGTPVARPLSASSLYRIVRPLNTSRPSTARGRPMSRAASEISEIKSIDSTDGHDQLFEDENERETLSVLEKELYALKRGDLATQRLASSSEQFQSPNGRTFPHAEDNPSFKRSQMHILENCVGESESDDEETMQDKHNVLSLQ